MGALRRGGDPVRRGTTSIASTSSCAWLDRLERDGVRLYNPVPLVRWNFDKRYLAELEERGIRIVPTRFFEAGARVDLAALVGEAGWGEAILKPAVSGGAHRTRRFGGRGRGRARKRELDDILRTSGALVQPFLDEIARVGRVVAPVLRRRVQPRGHQDAGGGRLPRAGAARRDPPRGRAAGGDAAGGAGRPGGAADGRRCTRASTASSAAAASSSWRSRSSSPTSSSRGRPAPSSATSRRCAAVAR